MRLGKFLRRIMPAWHAREKAFRAWYFDLADKFAAPADAASYATWLKLLRLPEEATGYREVRYPRMDAARQRGEEMLASLSPSTVAASRSRC
jgi:indolepyruvate ferredoxin oxidoreductase